MGPRLVPPEILQLVVAFNEPSGAQNIGNIHYISLQSLVRKILWEGFKTTRIIVATIKLRNYLFLDYNGR
jgi:hypothetical protein